MPGSKEILVVDDDQFHRDLLGMIVEAAGFIPVFAEDGLDGLQRLKGNRFAAVILDIQMPAVDGLSFIAHVRNTRLFDLSRVIVVTAVEEKDLGWMRTHPVHAVMRKPVDRNALTEALRACVAASEDA